MVHCQSFELSKTVLRVAERGRGGSRSSRSSARPPWAQDHGRGDDHQPQTRLSGYMDFHFNKPEFEDGAPRLPPLRAARHAPLQRPHPLRRRARARARVRRRARGSGRARARTGLRRLPAVARLQRARRHAAGAGRHHQRAPRAAGLLRRRAAVRRHRHHPDHLVRGRRRRARRGRPRLALSRVRDGAAERARVQRRGRASAAAGRRAPRPTSAAPRSPAALEYVGVRGLTVGASFWTGRVGLRVPAALRRAGARRRSRRALLARSPRAARPVRAGRHRQRRPS